MFSSKCHAATKTGSSGCTPRTLFLLSNVPLSMASPQQVSISSQYLSGYRTFCRGAQTHSGYNENPIARWVSMLAGPDYFLLTNRYLCPLCHGNDKGCGKTYQGSNLWIIRQLPKSVQQAFPVHTALLILAKMDVMKATFADHFGANPFLKMVRKLKVLHHHRLKAMQYLKSMFTTWFSVHHTLIDRVMSSLSATIIKADHTYKLELQCHSHHPTQLIYTDNPLAEQKFHKSINTSLCKNVQYLVLDAFSDLLWIKLSNIPIDYFSLQAGTVLKHSIPDFQYLSTHDWSGEVKEDDIKKLAQEVDCVAQIYQKLMKIDSMGLPLQQLQICAGQLVTLVIDKEALTKGELVAHNGSWPSPSDADKASLARPYNCKAFTDPPMADGTWGHTVVQICTLHTQSLTPPHPSNHDPSLGVPVPVNLPSKLSQHHPSRPSPLPCHTVEPDPAAYSREDETDTGPNKQELAAGF
ncbi:hypothetical protein DFH08DRAFT_802406 [Mycena albidolilacea]|uniref:Uncharacterized protein n=1 Tax=Mycena albidolilacea TaxID=1033008 RepID=A0AAD7AH97_9AGAR|nr:hypothetical protein DFH08DRAFT_802406 [Mycena albidolilacea]